MSTPSDKFDYAVHLGNVLLKDDFAGAPLCATGDEGVVRGAIRTVIDLAITAARAADAEEIARVNEKLRVASDQLLRIDRVLDDKSYASRMNQLDAIRAVLKEPTPLTELDELYNDLGEKYKALEAENAQLTTGITAKAEAAAKEIAEFEYDAHGYRVGTDTIELIINGKFTQEARP